MVESIAKESPIASAKSATEASDFRPDGTAPEPGGAFISSVGGDVAAEAVAAQRVLEELGLSPRLSAGFGGGKASAPFPVGPPDLGGLDLFVGIYGSEYDSWLHEDYSALRRNPPKTVLIFIKVVPSRDWRLTELIESIASRYAIRYFRDLPELVAALYNPPTAHPDDAAEQDLLGFDPYADALADIILKDETKPPLVIGVYGPWGSGKSTFMNIVRGKLAERSGGRRSRSLAGWRPWRPRAAPTPEVIPVGYDAWAYADAPKLWAGLVADVARHLDAKLGWYGRTVFLFRRHLRQLVVALLLGLIPVALLLLAASTRYLGDTVQDLGLQAKVLGLVVTTVLALLPAGIAQRQPVSAGVASLAAQFDSAPASGVINGIQDELNHALTTATLSIGSGKDDGRGLPSIIDRAKRNELKIVVFIDELDRCPLDRIVDILESIKLFLAEELFIVLLAVDTRVAAEAIRLHYKDGGQPDLPREYLEKIVQLPLRVPTADRDELANYLRAFMAVAPAPNGGGQRAPATGAATPSPPASGATALPAERPRSRIRSWLPRRIRRFLGLSDPAVDAAEARVASRIQRPTSPLLQLQDTKDEFDELCTLSERFLDGNPRRIKRLLNTYRYVKRLALTQAEGERVREPAWQKTALAWLAFTMRWPSFMEEAIDRAERIKGQGVHPAFLVEVLEEIRQRPAGEPREEDAPPSDRATVSQKAAPGFDMPDRDDLENYLPIDHHEVIRWSEVAGNFLIENPAPKVGAREDRMPAA
jgi:hypothetical protein